MLTHSELRSTSQAQAVVNGSPAWASRTTLMRVLMFAVMLALVGAGVFGQEAAPVRHAGGEANLVLPDFEQATFLGGMTGRTLLMGGLAVGILGLLFGLLDPDQVHLGS